MSFICLDKNILHQTRGIKVTATSHDCTDDALWQNKHALRCNNNGSRDLEARAHFALQVAVDGGCCQSGIVIQACALGV